MIGELDKILSLLVTGSPLETVSLSVWTQVVVSSWGPRHTQLPC